MHRIQPIVGYREGFISFVLALDKREYSKALCIVCTHKSDLVIQLVNILLEYKGILRNIDEPAGARQRTAAHCAALAGNKQVYEALVKSGANITLEDKDGFTAAYYASQHFVSNPGCTSSAV
jgi:hypothetical protein